MARKSTKSESVEPVAATSSPATTKKSTANTPVSKSRTSTPAKDANNASAVTPKSASRRQSSRPKKSTVAAAAGKGSNTLVQFALAEAIAISLSVLGHLLVAELSGRELATLKAGGGKSLEEYALQAAWRIFALAIAWFAELDFLDVAAMTFLTYAPAGYLLSTFYWIRPVTVISTVLVEIIAAAAPIYLLRPVSAVHKPNAKVHNRELFGGITRIYVTIFAIAVYTVTIVLSSRFVLPRVLVVSFAGVRTVDPAYQATHVHALPLMVAFGASAAAFLFPSFVATGKSKEDDKIKQFDPVDASLSQTFWWNFWGYTVKTKVLLRRTAITVVSTGMGTYLTCTIPIDGVDSAGAIAYAGIWVLAAVLTACGIGYIGQD